MTASTPGSSWRASTLWYSKGMALTARALLVSALALAGCRAPASKLPEAEVLRFGVSHMGGSTSFVIRADRTATYQQSGGRNGTVKLEATVTEEELGALAQLLEEKGFCSLVSSRSTGVPDEARPGVDIRLGNLDCSVTMWDNEFRDDEDAKAALAAIEELGATLRERGNPP